MIAKNWKPYTSFLAFFILILTPLSSEKAWGCTVISLTASDGTIVYGRTMEWSSSDLQTKAVVVPRGSNFQSETPDGKLGMKWSASFGFLGFEVLDREIVDGMNEAGLAVGLFFEKGPAGFADFDTKRSERTLDPASLVPYILSSFSDLEEVKEGLMQIDVVPVEDPSGENSIAGSFMVTAPSGGSMVIEFSGGKPVFSDNPLGVSTDSLSFEWQVTNLSNYGFVTGNPFEQVRAGDIEIQPLSEGSGLLGTPGDFTSPSRFVRASIFSRYARPTRMGIDTVQEIFRIMDSFNLPPWHETGTDLSYVENLPSGTSWTVCHDTRNRLTYYHTAFNRRVRMIDLGRLDFEADFMKKIPLDATRAQDLDDVTEKFR
ncbi:MAG TPA: linear amide C-N hydrolase [Synergistales bacterium]|jgi:choloylglycine hydrolase|nr:linear amide C-N hydrolase [Synergistales bacterium]MDI9391801.1 linear amide C-N hydrolase [Synergistota bacterium]NLV65834.1 linear amide C-N hydrolase [Synergistaceae bacterium]HRW86840.1 linear amide C-N hydrolase [Thermovirgaceae bacterium]MDD5514041.1 linear amide C-N hydrolase [Synergistales bacterium]